MRLLLVSCLALVLVPAAWAAVTVTQGTLLHGDETSLSATDGNALDIQAALDNGRYHASFTVDLGRVDGLRGIHFAAWASRRVRCSGSATGNVRVRKTLTTGEDLNIPSSAYTAWVGCQSLAPFTLHWDELTEFAR